MLSSFPGRLLTVALGVGLCAPAAFSQPAAATGPWAKVPALPTTTVCYTATDTFPAKLDKALAAVKADRERQHAINEQIADEYKSIDPMEMASRMQQWMMDNPQEAMEYMQGIQAVGTAEGQAEVLEDPAEMARWDNDRKDLIKRYHAGLAQAYAPANARFKALLKKVGADENSPTVMGTGTPEWAIAEEDAIYRARDQAYAAHCPQWWAAAGPAQTWLKSYKTWLIQEHIPVVDGHAAQLAQTYAIMSTPSASYRSLGTLDSVIKYLEVVAAVYAERMEKPRCTAALCVFGQ